MSPEDLKALLAAKRRSTEPLSPEDAAQGFKGWYASRKLPHFDSPGTQQFITYRLADALSSERRSEWQALLTITDELDKQRKSSVTSIEVLANVTFATGALPNWFNTTFGITMEKNIDCWPGL